MNVDSFNSFALSYHLFNVMNSGQILFFDDNVFDVIDWR